MFTGIVEEIGGIRSADRDGLVIVAPKVTDDLASGDSICVNGACLTVTARDEDSFGVDVVPETLRRTNLGALRAGDGVNLERSTPVGGRLGGHIVQGHVDGTGVIESMASDDRALLVEVRAPLSIMRYVVEKGFIAVDGTSLTIVKCDSSAFVITIIPFTRDNTLFGSRRVGGKVNLEVDILAKYVERLLGER